MRWLCGELSCDVRALLEKERTVAALPASTRAVAIARAREALTSKAAVLWPGAIPGLLPSLAIAGLIGMAGAVAGVGAFVLATRLAPPAVVAVAPVAAPPAPADPRPAAGPPADSAIVELSEAARAVPGTDGHEELRLLELARARLAREDFAAAMAVLTEHARRFRQGRLVEEREALRVDALSGLGRRDEARRAAAAFQARFPRSPLLAVVRQMASAEP